MMICVEDLHARYGMESENSFWKKKCNITKPRKRVMNAFSRSERKSEISTSIQLKRNEREEKNIKI